MLMKQKVTKQENEKIENIMEQVYQGCESEKKH